MKWYAPSTSLNHVLQGKLRFANSIGTWILNTGSNYGAHQNSDVNFGASLCLWALWIIRAWKNSIWKGPQRVCSPTSCSKPGELWNQTRLLSAYTNMSLEIFKDEHCTTPLSNLVQCLASLMVKNLCLISCINFSGFNLCIASVLYALKFVPELSSLPTKSLFSASKESRGYKNKLLHITCYC